MNVKKLNFDSYIETDTSPSDFNLKVSKMYLLSKKYSERLSIGQFITSISMATKLTRYMASVPKSDSIKIIDLGAGTGMLSVSLVEEIAKIAKVREINLDLIEIDKDILPYLTIVMEYLVLWGKTKDISIRYKIIDLDIICNSPFNNLFHPLEKSSYDYVISNPPYFKISKSIQISEYYSDILNGQVNAYAIFMNLGIDLLKDNGIGGFITPQSFFNGNSFSNLRQKLLSSTSIYHISTSRSRYAQFLEEKVLQKICMSCFRKNSEHVEISFDYIDDPDQVSPTKYPDLIQDGVIYTPLESGEHYLLKEIFQYKYKLSDYGLNISTGSLVPHETPQILSINPTSTPLIWLKHVKDGYVEWPLKNFRRSEYLKASAPASKVILNGNYILLRRCAFSETRRHLYCSIFRGIASYKSFGIENHVNYIFFTSNNLSDEEQISLLNLVHSYLTSEHATAFFKSRCGNTQINVNDVRALPFPDLFEER